MKKIDVTWESFVGSDDTGSRLYEAIRREIDAKIRSGAYWPGMRPGTMNFGGQRADKAREAFDRARDYWRVSKDAAFRGMDYDVFSDQPRPTGGSARRDENPLNYCDTCTLLFYAVRDDVEVYDAAEPYDKDRGRSRFKRQALFRCATTWEDRP